MAGDASTTLREARAAYFEANDLPEAGGYEAAWVRVRGAGIPVFAYPNSKGRRAVVRQHDLHHVLTGYGTDIAGEGELAAWELASGVTSFTGRQLALRVLGFALLRSAGSLFTAFQRGRHCRNLLKEPWDDALLDRTAAEVRGELGIEGPFPEPSREDRRAFLGWAAKAAAIVWGPLVPLALLGWWWLR